MTGTIRIETDARGIATLSLARAEKHNAMSAEMIEALTEAAATLGDDPKVRAVILAGDGPTFCAGGDLGWMKAQMEADRSARMAEARKLAEMLRALDRMPKPLIGRIHGNAFGGGVGLASVCDVAIGTPAVKMGLTETRLGVIPATIGPYVAARVGPGALRAVFFSGQRFDAQEALRLGLLTRCVPPDDLDAAVAAEAEAYLACAPGAVAAAKALLRGFAPPVDDALLDRTVAALADVWETEEAAAGIAAFFDRRPAPWIVG
ncbi:crotonase/enoyl-CoA hydratase family protein [Pseudoruegeria sp. HB172150]|uniref:crotonase/enoyl-CoA hydratase family protein n=1 Tax=Pseudoruegeria sp. HB172150 TaxID=2721164 RepID=UPI00155408DE|nr:crotonase/enoyl-CoA hydratase family protein [Pseudoruegeria sp. HB172150]